MKQIKTFFSELTSNISEKIKFKNIKSTFTDPEHSFKAHLILTAVLSLIIAVVVQSFECRNVVGGFLLLFTNPFFFVFNYSIIFFTLTISFLFKKRLFFISLFSILWILLGVANYIVMLYRPMPMSSIDFVVLTTAFEVIPHYFSILQIILCIIGIILAISLLVILFIKSKKYFRTIKTSLITPLLSFAVMMCFIFIGSLTHLDNISYEDVNEAYDGHGFIYCFASSFFKHGIEAPGDYSEQSVKAITSKLTYTSDEEVHTPNIIVIQLESFFDVAKYNKYILSDDPIKNFHAICEKHGVGSLHVPSNGGGTVNTEFEILTGMNLEYFETIEYPYTTIMKEKTCESIPYILEKYSYTSHALHNHTGVFYARNEVYPNLGFDYFIPLEFMQYTESENGWAKDTAILDNIEKALNHTEGNDFIFAVTVEGHGAYSTEHDENAPYKITNKDDFDGHEYREATRFEYYCKLLAETDSVIGELYDYVMNCDEETVVVLYGDHLPSLELEEKYYEYGSDYMTSYTVFSNIPEKFNYQYVDKLSTNHLLSSVLEKLNIRSGVVLSLNQNYPSDNYDYNMKQIQYDMLYGKGYSYSNGPYPRKQTKMWYDKISVNSYTHDGQYLTITGENFTPKSHIFIDGKKYNTEFIDSETLKCECKHIPNNCKISVCQLAVGGVKLNEAEY